MSLLDEWRKKLLPNADARKELDALEKNLESQLSSLRLERERRAKYQFDVRLVVNADRLADMAGDEVLTPSKVQDMLETAIKEWIAESPFGPVVDVAYGNVSNNAAATTNKYSNAIMSAAQMTSITGQVNHVGGLLGQSSNLGGAQGMHNAQNDAFNHYMNQMNNQP